MFGKNLNGLHKLLIKLKNVFEITVNKNPSSFVGLEIEKQENGIKVSQKNYSRKVLELYDMRNAKAVDTPILTNDENNNEMSRTKLFPFREAIESLLCILPVKQDPI